MILHGIYANTLLGTLNNRVISRFMLDSEFIDIVNPTQFSCAPNTEVYNMPNRAVMVSVGDRWLHNDSESVVGEEPEEIKLRSVRRNYSLNNYRETVAHSKKIPQAAERSTCQVPRGYWSFPPIRGGAQYRRTRINPPVMCVSGDLSSCCQPVPVGTQCPEIAESGSHAF
ncbi:hypothetical protein K438DRAFT_1755671 [Mycena galopus ATCC 62051]|nr:hypothetical protein K438DRAFT_1755671 [Mycena galopus ATCC 62051]